jgi:uncharacterized protein (UPF0335 family)
MIDLKDFPKDLQDKIEKILLSNEDHLFYGSINDPHIIFRGDIDIMQIVKRKDSRKSILAEIKDLFRAILKIRDGSYYLGEVKMGENVVVRDEVDRLLKNKSKINKKQIAEFLERMKGDGHDVSKIQKVLKMRLTDEVYYNLVDEMRSLYVYRWTGRDIIDGKADFTLEQDDLICKFDVQLFMGRYFETSNYIQFPDLVKKEDEKDEEFLRSLRLNIVKQYYSDRNYYKTAKRLLTYYKQKGDEKMMQDIYELINNPILGNLYIMKTGLSVLKTIIENNKGKIKKDLIRLSLQSLKMNTIFLDDEERDLFNKKIDKIYNTLSLKNIEGLLTEVNDYLQAETLKWGEEIGFNMPKIVKSFVEK